MPNWCANTLYISYINENDDKSLAKEKLNKLVILAKAINNWSQMGNYQPGSLVNIVDNARIADRETVLKMSLRGYLTEIARVVDSKFLVIDYDTAWTPILEPWLEVFDKYLGEDNYDLQYMSCEPGCQIFSTNMPELRGNYYVDIYDDRPVAKDGKDHSYANRNVAPEKIKIILQDIYQKEFETVLDALVHAENNQILGLYISIYKWEWVDYREFIEKGDGGIC